MPQLQHQHPRLKERVGSAPALGAGDGALDGEHMRTAALLNKSASADSGLFFRSSSREIPKKKVRFSNVTNVILVPTRQDYFDHNLDKKLWWTEDDYEVFKKSAVREVSALINIYRIDAKTALARLGLGELAGDVTKGAAVECAPSINPSVSDSNLQRMGCSEGSSYESPDAGGGGARAHPNDDSSASVYHRNQPSLSSSGRKASTDLSGAADGVSEGVATGTRSSGLAKHPLGSTEVHTSINALPATAVRLPSPKRASSSSSIPTELQGISLGLGVTPKNSSALHPLAYMAGF
jgi:hypothetical protein